MSDWQGTRLGSSQDHKGSAAHGSELVFLLFKEWEAIESRANNALGRAAPPAQQLLTLVCRRGMLASPEPHNIINSLRIILSKNLGLNSDSKDQNS